MKYYFLKNDFLKLNRQISEIEDRIKNIGMEMGKSCSEGAETYHDNFAFEEGERMQRMWSLRLRELMDVYCRAIIVDEPKDLDKAVIGKEIIIMDDKTEDIKKIRIGSYYTFGDSDTVSYNSPLGSLILGSRQGDIVSGTICGVKKSYEIIQIN